MNQQLIFNDDAMLDSARQAIVCSVMDGGMKLRCVVSLEYLSRLNGSPVPLNQLLDCFEQYRFDIEDEIEAMLAKEQFNQAGELELH
ncbi:DUF1488 domain-containing protein [Shewanella avicenniae]|uniref:DUF1488 domain-containing protein n=1 Tax=Shewanella avicenniae TaxID=2814294 RepID=A0ABX7QS57_9GAMM|nr:DUF1488 domain-containing protein [Shewanella avicenniae]QSX33718.1 DUF1488 domain-containing protein [Shewanella avicenniae]